jgi:DNA-binding LacI/PurR family transcriptional regulator
MLEIIDKNSKTALSVQVSEKLIDDIRAGRIKPGKRMPGERRLAERFGISRGTVIEALDLLEKQNYIERIPAKGTFVADDVDHELKVVRIAFPFPEESISPSSLGHMENWGIVSEIYRGMIEEAKVRNAEISFMHFEEAETEIQLSRQQRRIEDFDGAVFIGHQLAGIRKKIISENIPCVQIEPDKNETPVCSMVCGDKEGSFSEICAHLASRGYERLWLLIGSETCKSPTDYRSDKLKVEKLLRCATECGLTLADDGSLEIDYRNPEEIRQALVGKSFRKGKDAIYCSHSDFVIPVYKFCMENDLKIGKDIGIWGYASGITFNNLIPELTYGKIDHFTMGRKACGILIDAVRAGVKQLNQEIVPGRLIIGQST